MLAHGLLMGLSWDALGELSLQGHEFAMKKAVYASFLFPLSSSLIHLPSSLFPLPSSIFPLPSSLFFVSFLLF